MAWHFEIYVPHPGIHSVSLCCDFILTGHSVLRKYAAIFKLRHTVAVQETNSMQQTREKTIIINDENSMSYYITIK